jgi:hypothetical protein
MNYISHPPLTLSVALHVFSLQEHCAMVCIGYQAGSGRTLAGETFSTLSEEKTKRFYSKVS